MSRPLLTTELRERTMIDGGLWVAAAPPDVSVPHSNPWGRRSAPVGPRWTGRVVPSLAFGALVLRACAPALPGVRLSVWSRRSAVAGPAFASCALSGGPPPLRLTLRRHVRRVALFTHRPHEHWVARSRPLAARARGHGLDRCVSRQPPRGVSRGAPGGQPREPVPRGFRRRGALPADRVPRPRVRAVRRTPGEYARSIA